MLAIADITAKRAGAPFQRTWSPDRHVGLIRPMTGAARRVIALAGFAALAAG
jgi:hypothetical protein